MAKVLIADDQVIIAMQLQACVEEIGHDVIGLATNGREAVSLAEQLRPDVVLMDIIMETEDDGIRAADVVYSTMGIPVIFVTAHAQRSLIDQAKAVVPLGYIVKPFDPREIHAAIEIAMGRMDLERRLRESARRYRMATTTGRVGIWEWDLERNSVRLEPLLWQMLGYPDGDTRLKFNAWLRMMHPDDVKAFRQRLERHLVNPSEPFEMERRFRHRDGHLLWFLTRAQVVNEESGKMFRIMGTDADITQRKLAEEALRKSKERFRNMVETTSDWIWELDMDYRFAYVSPQVIEMMGYRPEELVGKRFFDLMSAEAADRLRRHFEQVVRDKGRGPYLESFLISKEGKPVVVESSVVACCDCTGGLQGFRGISRDVTERKRMEEALQRSHEELEWRVEERTRELVRRTDELKARQQELQLSKSELERINQQLSESNTAIAVLARRMEKIQQEKERKVASLVRRRILPIVRELQDLQVPEPIGFKVETLAGYLDELLKGITAGAEIASLLSTTEWKVATLIRDGCKTGEIASKLGISIDTVKTHRKNIRKKLGIQNSSINLTSFLKMKLK